MAMFSPRTSARFNRAAVYDIVNEMKDLIIKLDSRIISFLRRINEPLARISLFVVYFWFGALKVVGSSPANPLVNGLFQKTMPFVSFNQFIIFFGLVEMLIGVLFLIRGMERTVIAIMVIHMITTIMPLLFLSAMTWSGFLTPTLEGQYIIKNIALLSVAVSIAVNLIPLSEKK